MKTAKRKYKTQFWIKCTKSRASDKRREIEKWFNIITASDTGPDYLMEIISDFVRLNVLQCYDLIAVISTLNKRIKKKFSVDQ